MAKGPIPTLYWETAAKMIDRAFQSVRPRRVVAAAVQWGDGEMLTIDNRDYDLSNVDNIYVVGGGKASLQMTSELNKILGDRITNGVVNVYGREQAEQADPTNELISTRDEGPVRVHRLGKVKILPASHIKPNECGKEGVRRMMELLSQETKKDDLVIAVISGGGSDLMGSPVDGIALEDLQETTRLLKGRKADIGEINAVRKHIDRAKGGKMRAAATGVGHFVTLAISDVPVVVSRGRLRMDPPDVIASGPTVGDESTYKDAYQVLHDHDLVLQVPWDVVEYLKAGIDGRRRLQLGGQWVDVLPENPRPDHHLFAAEGTQYAILGNNDMAVVAAAHVAREAGFTVVMPKERIHQEVHRTAREILGEIIKYANTAGPTAIVWGGEPTVNMTVETDERGEGGRNRHLALLVARLLDEADLENVVFASFGTDGQDASDEAAGAITNAETLRAGGREKAGEALRRFDAGGFLGPLGVQVRLERETNVADVAFALINHPRHPKVVGGRQAVSRLWR